MHDDNGGQSDRLAPVIPLFGDRGEVRPAPIEPRAEGAESRAAAAPQWHQTWTDEVDETGDVDADRAGEIEAAEQSLLKKLRSHSLSLREARAALERAGLTLEEASTVTDRFAHNGYLDDAALADQLIHKGLQRKGQGRQAIARALSQRGLDRDTIDAALAELPDDDAERALEFARSKVSAMEGLDRDVALRRLAGQLARRGYGGAALSAARQALDEQVPARRSVRFE